MCLCCNIRGLVIIWEMHNGVVALAESDYNLLSDRVLNFIEVFLLLLRPGSLVEFVAQVSDPGLLLGSFWAEVGINLGVCIVFSVFKKILFDDKVGLIQRSFVLQKLELVVTRAGDVFEAHALFLFAA